MAAAFPIVEVLKVTKLVNPQPTSLIVVNSDKCLNGCGKLVGTNLMGHLGHIEECPNVEAVCPLCECDPQGRLGDAVVKHLVELHKTTVFDAKGVVELNIHSDNDVQDDWLLFDRGSKEYAVLSIAIKSDGTGVKNFGLTVFPMAARRLGIDALKKMLFKATVAIGAEEQLIKRTMTFPVVPMKKSRAESKSQSIKTTLGAPATILVKIEMEVKDL